MLSHFQELFADLNYGARARSHIQQHLGRCSDLLKIKILNLHMNACIEKCDNMVGVKCLTCFIVPLGSQNANQPRRHPGSMNLFDKAPMVITGEMCAKDAIGTNLLPPKAICAYTSSAMTGIPKSLAVSTICRIQ